MFCKQCGKEITENAEVCTHCGARQTPPVQIKSHLAEAIITTLCCCLPFGIVSIVYAAKVSSLLQSGDVAGAQQASSKASMWAWIAFGIGIVINGIYLALQVLGTFADHAAS